VILHGMQSSMLSCARTSLSGSGLESVSTRGRLELAIVDECVVGVVVVTDAVGTKRRKLLR